MCHQSISLIARHLEANGISTVVMGCARDIVEQAAVPRFWFSDFPLGHSAGKPHDVASQLATLQGALRLFEEAEAPNTTVMSPQRWAADEAWKQDFMDISKLSAETLAKLKAAHEHTRAVKANKERAGE